MKDSKAKKIEKNKNIDIDEITTEEVEENVWMCEERKQSKEEAEDEEEELEAKLEEESV